MPTVQEVSTQGVAQLTAEQQEAQELAADVGFYADAILAAAKAQATKPPAVLKLTPLKRISDELAALYDELRLDGLIIPAAQREAN